MKIFPLTLLAGCLLCPSLALAQTRVEFVHPERYTDATLRSVPADKSGGEVAAELTRTIREVGDKRLRGRRLEVRVLDVRLAGRRAFERPADRDDIRILDDTHPPHIVVEYRVLAADSGKVLAAGREDLTDVNYRQVVFVDYTERFFYERNLLREWIARLADRTNRETPHRR